MMKNKKKFKSKKIYSEVGFFKKFGYFIYLLIKDIIYVIKYGRSFNEYGVTMFTGKQGSGKTLGIVEYLERMRKKFPDVMIVTNFGYIHEHSSMNNWKDFFNIRNGDKGVIFAIDEIQNELASTDWKNVPEGLLSEITQQRKQKVKIVASSQVFTRVNKSLREQTFEVVECFTLAGRWTFLKAFEPEEYEALIADPTRRRKLRRKWRRNFVNNVKLRKKFDSYAKIERIQRTEYVDVKDRLTS